jgi:hypothetical protein
VARILTNFIQNTTKVNLARLYACAAPYASLPLTSIPATPDLIISYFDFRITIMHRHNLSSFIKIQFAIDTISE